MGVVRVRKDGGFWLRNPSGTVSGHTSRENYVYVHEAKPEEEAKPGEASAKQAKKDSDREKKKKNEEEEDADRAGSPMHENGRRSEVLDKPNGADGSASVGTAMNEP